MQEAAEIDDLPRTDSARTFVRKYQQSYNADRPPANSLKASRAMQDTTKYRNNNGFDQLEKSLQSESVLHKPKELDGNELPSDFHALLELDKTLKSDSRFVYPDGRAFIPGGGKSSRPSSSKPRPNLTYQLQPYENASAIPVTIPLPQPPQSPSTLPRKYELKIDETLDFINAQSASTLSPSRSISTFGPDSPAGSAMTLASERSRRKQNDFSGSDRNDDDNDNDNDGLDFDIDRAFRRNRRKWELLEKMGLRTEESMDFEAKEKSNVYSGPEELDLLLNGLQSVHSSRPSTANSRPQNSRPGTAGTLQGDSQLIGQGDYGYLLQQERDKYRQNKQQQGTRRRQPSHNLKPQQPQNQSRPSSATFSPTSSTITTPRSPRAHSQGSKIRKSNALQDSGRRAVSKLESFEKLSNTMEKNKFNDMAARRNSNIKQRMNTAFSDRNSESHHDHSHAQQQQKGATPQLYSSVSTDQVHDIDYSDYGF
mmetsp:Transcript_27843/g.47053  ORF Transcript_27843/g.47053 Transcript_27843/m.47053 type:complete len:482 (+) Transcript_27843:1-1446(+)